MLTSLYCYALPVKKLDPYNGTIYDLKTLSGLPVRSGGYRGTRRFRFSRKLAIFINLALCSKTTGGQLWTARLFSPQ